MTSEIRHGRRFVDKVAVVTGAGNGIGLTIAQAYSLEGALVVIADVNASAGERACQEIVTAGGRALSVQTDVSDEYQVQEMVEAVIKAHGQIDILVNNAGVVLHKLVIDMQREEWDRQIAVQQTGPFLTSKHVARHMIGRGGYGKIVNISSLSGMMGRVRGSAHCVSKAGLILLTKVLAMELAQYRINVNAVAPGLIDVPVQRNEETLSLAYRDSYVKMIPAGHMGETSDIANAVLFLSSSDADWISGEQLVVDGGTMAGHYALGKQHDYAGLSGHT